MLRHLSNCLSASNGRRNPTTLSTHCTDPQERAAGCGAAGAGGEAAAAGGGAAAQGGGSRSSRSRHKACGAHPRCACLRHFCAVGRGGEQAVQHCAHHSGRGQTAVAAHPGGRHPAGSGTAAGRQRRTRLGTLNQQQARAGAEAAGPGQQACCGIRRCSGSSSRWCRSACWRRRWQHQHCSRWQPGARWAADLRDLSLQVSCLAGVAMARAGPPCCPAGAVQPGCAASSFAPVQPK